MRTRQFAPFPGLVFAVIHLFLMRGDAAEQLLKNGDFELPAILDREVLPITNWMAVAFGGAPDGRVLWPRNPVGDLAVIQ